MANIMPKTIGNPRKGSLCKAALVVVATVTVNGTLVVVAESVTPAGLIEQVVPAGAPEQVRATVPLNPEAVEVAERLYVAAWPAATVADVVPAKLKRPLTVIARAGETAAV